MIKKIFTITGMAALGTMHLFAANTDITVDTIITADPGLQNNTITIKGGVTYTVDSTVMSLKANSGITVEAGAIWEFKGSGAQFKTVDGINAIDVYGTIMATNNVGLFTGDNAGAKTTFTLYDGARMTAASGQTYNWEIRRGYGVYNFNKGSIANSINSLKIGDRNDAGFDVTFNIQGSVTVNNETTLGSATTFTSAGPGKGAINVSNGGVFTTRTLVAGKVQYFDAAITLKDAGSRFTVTGQADLGAASTVAGSGVKIDVSSGAQFLFGGVVNYNETADMTLNITSATEGTSQALVKVNGALTFASGAAMKIEIDSDLTAEAFGYDETAQIVLFEIGSTITVGGQTKTMSDLAAMSSEGLFAYFGTFIDFDFSGNANWSAADLGNLVVSGNQIILELHTPSEIPEPATYAAIFGLLALAFAAYRRRK